ncbi:MAG: shikimate kinase [Candidatus Planktophila sp.]|nr:shikimate kinase [Candidatus Planktophila sp.]
MKPIVLIGPPGAGKSTVGKALAEQLSLEFLDTDSLIEQSTGKSITDIFVVDGEQAFRAIEFQMLRTVLEKVNVIISLGGGAPISNEAQKLISDADCQVVFLDISLATAAPRVGFNRDRPLLLGNPRAQWQALSDQRRPIYEVLSNQTVKVDGLSVAEIVDAITKGMR